MPNEMKRFRKALRNNGCMILREASNHTIWKDPLNNKQSSLPRHSELVNITCKVICKQLEVKNIL